MQELVFVAYSLITDLKKCWTTSYFQTCERHVLYLWEYDLMTVLNILERCPTFSKSSSTEKEQMWGLFVRLPSWLLYPFRGHGGGCTYGRRQVHPGWVASSSQGPVWAFVGCCLAQWHLGDALKVFWHLPLQTPSMFCLQWGSKEEPSPSQPSPRQTALPPDKTSVI